MIELISNSVEQTMELGRKLAQSVKPDDCVVLTGDLGAGKTHFSKGFAEGLGVQSDITSPTFNIVLEYEEGRLPLLHFDLYRLEEEWELEDIDWYGMTESGGVYLVEWGDRFPDALPEERLLIDIRVELDGTRILHVSGVGKRGTELESVLS